MQKFKEKQCDMCYKIYTPTSPKQKFCSLCKSEARRLAQKVRDKERNRIKHNIEYEKICPACKVNFRTFDSKRKYCGKEACEQIRKNMNGNKADKRRNVVRSKKRKIERYKKQGTKLKYIKSYIENIDYKLLKARKYKNTHYSLLKVVCPKGHIWHTTFHNFKDNNNRCATCYQQNNYVSKIEQYIRDYLEDNLPNVKVIYNNRSILSPKELDFYFPEHNLAVEVCGLYWHGELNAGKNKSYHYDKMMECYNKGIRLITVFEDELIESPDIVISRIRQALGAPEKIISAKDCVVKEVDSKTANTFYKENHIQGKSTLLISYGLFYNNELVCVGSLGKVGRKHDPKETTLEFKRFCSLTNLLVIEGINKLFKRMVRFAKENNYTVIKSYCDMRYSNIHNPVYEMLGFDLDGLKKYTSYYFKNGKRYSNYSLRKTQEERLTDKTVWELRQEQGYDRIWDCGYRTYIYKLN